ncbi:hypothetical protein HYV11_00180 [Candidatus Dependentiae bacterium]|nr:hypothetical protein [Candidatus Dependentiae bacterium]
MLKAILLKTNVIRITSCIIGYSLWSFLASYQTIIIEKEIPLCFYQIDKATSVTAPETIKVSLSGKRKDIYLLQPDHIAIHINATDYQEGKHLLHLQREHFFLPDQIHLYRINQPSISIEIIKNKKLES